MKKTERLEIRLTEKEKNKAKMLADIYSGGILSRWIRHAIVNAPRKKIKKTPDQGG